MGHLRFKTATCVSRTRVGYWIRNAQDTIGKSICASAWSRILFRKLACELSAGSACSLRYCGASAASELEAKSQALLSPVTLLPATVHINLVDTSAGRQGLAFLYFVRGFLWPRGSENRIW